MSETLKPSHETSSETPNESYNIWQQKMSEVPPFDDADRETNKTETVEELSDHDAVDKLFKTLNSEHKELLATGDIAQYGGSLDSSDLNIDIHGDALNEQMDLLNDAYNALNDPDEYGATNSTLSDVLSLMSHYKMVAWQESEDQYGQSDPHTLELKRAYNIAEDLLDRFKATKSEGTTTEPDGINHPYIREEVRDAVVERDGDDSMKMEQIPAGKSAAELDLERHTVKMDADFKARMEAYQAEKRVNEQKRREGQERIQNEQAEAEAERQRILREQREKVLNTYRQNTGEKSIEEQEEDEMEMGM